MPIRFPLVAAAALTAALLGSTAARADVIDGDWCSVDGARMFSIRGAAIVTPGGQRAQGSYARHYFSYVVPAGEPRAGQTVSMMQLNEDTIRITDAPDRAAAMNAPGEIWHRCRAPTS